MPNLNGPHVALLLLLSGCASGAGQPSSGSGVSSAAPADRPAPSVPAAANTNALAAPAAPSALAWTVDEAFKQICEGPGSIPMDVRGSRHSVDVTLKGPKATATVRMHIDTGGNTPGLMLAQSVADRLGFASAEALPKVLRVGSQEIPLPDGASWFLADDVSEKARQSPMSERRLRNGWSDGQIGAGFLSRFLLCVDPAKGRLGLGRPGAVEIGAPDGRPWIPLLMLPGGKNRALYPFLQVQLKARGQAAGEVGMLLDTGATTSMLERDVIEKDLGAIPGLSRAKGAAGDADMIGGKFPEIMIRVDSVTATAPEPLVKELGLPARPSVDLGPALFVSRGNGTWRSIFGDLPPIGAAVGAIANDVLNRYRLLIDYPRARLWIEPTGRALDVSASMVRVGVAIAFEDDGCPVIRQVTDTNAPPTREAIRAGDVLLEVDGEAMCGRYHHEVAAALAGAPGAAKRLKVRRGGATKSVSAEVRDLLP
jgi:hypothetical protein